MESGQQGDNQKPSQRVVRGRGASRRMEAPAGVTIAASGLVQTPGGSGTEPRCGDQAGAGGGRGRVVRGRGAVRRMEARTHNTGGEAGRRSPTPTSVNRCGDGGGAAGGGDNGSGGARRVRGRGSVRRMGRDDDGRVVRGRGAVRQMEARTQTAANSSSNRPVAQGRTVRGRGADRRMEATAGSTPAAGPAVSRAPAGSPAASSAQSRAGSGSVAAAGSTVGDATRNDVDDGDAEVDALIPRLQATNLTPKAKHQPSPNHGGGRGSPVAAAAPPSVPSRGAAGGRTAGAYVPPHLKTRTGNNGRGQARGSPAGGRTPPPPLPGARRRPRSTAHLLEIGNIPAGMQPHHVHSIIQLQTGFQDEDFTVQVVSRGVMLACFTGEAAATQALAKFRHRAIKLRLVSSATVAGVSSLPRPVKPKRDVTVARRLIGRALGVRTTAPSTRSSRETAGQSQRSAPAAATPPARKVRGRGATRRGGASGSRTRGWDDDSW